MSTQLPASQENAQKPIEQKTNKTGLVLLVGCILFFCMLMLCAGGIVFLATQSENIENEENTNQGSEDEETDLIEDELELNESEQIEEDMEIFEGEYISAELIAGWTIVEYEDGQGGYGLLSDGDYQGLTAIVVRDPDGNDVYSIEAVNGVGGVDACQMIWTFDDTSEIYIQQKQDAYAEVYPGQTSLVVEQSPGEYQDFELLGRRGRLHDGVIFWDATNTSLSFDPNCGMPASLPLGVGLSFDYQAGPGQFADTLTSYFLTPKDGMENADTEALVSILGSIEVN